MTRDELVTQLNARSRAVQERRAQSAKLAKLKLRLVCEACDKLLVEIKQREVNGAPQVAKLRLDQAIKVHVMVCTGPFLLKREGSPDVGVRP